MVLSKTAWPVGLGVFIGRVDSLLCEHHHEEFGVCFVNPIDDLRHALRWCFRCAVFPALDPQPLYISARIPEVGSFIHLFAVWGCERAIALKSNLKPRQRSVGIPGNGKLVCQTRHSHIFGYHVMRNKQINPRLPAVSPRMLGCMLAPLNGCVSLRQDFLIV